jgi:hypothetical protein
MQGDSEETNQTNDPIFKRDLSDNEQGSLFADSASNKEDESISVSHSNDEFDNY